MVSNPLHNENGMGTGLSNLPKFSRIEISNMLPASALLSLLIRPLIFLYTLAVSPSLGGSRQHRRNNKTLGISLRSSGNDKGPCGVWHKQKNSTKVFSAFRKRRLKGTERGDWESPPLV